MRLTELTFPVAYLSHLKSFPSDEGTARPQVADEGDGLQIWRVAADSRHGVALQLQPK
jgi:hypothetical protein